MNDNLYEVQILNEHECGSFKRNSSVAPFSLIISLFPFFFFCGLIGSFYLSLICPLWDLFFVLFGIFFFLFGIFSHFKGNTLYFTRSIEDLSHFTRSTQHKENMKLS